MIAAEHLVFVAFPKLSAPALVHNMVLLALQQAVPTHLSDAAASFANAF